MMYSIMLILPTPLIVKKFRVFGFNEILVIPSKSFFEITRLCTFQPAHLQSITTTNIRKRPFRPKV
jgi:hypothetical protein